MPKKVEVSYKTIIVVVAIITLVWFLLQIKAVILTLFISLILMTVINPLIRRMERLKIPRWLAILLVYVAIFAVIALAIGGIIPPLVEQTTNLVNHIPGLLRQIRVLGIDEKTLASQLSQFSAIPTDLIKIIFGIFSNIVSVLALAAITFYMLLERGNLDRYLILLFGEDKEIQINNVIDRIEVRLGGWVRGQLILMLSTGVLCYLGYRIIGLNFALPLAILAFIFEIIPGFGSTAATFPAILLGLAISPIHAISVAAWAFLVQQLQHTIIGPKVMKEAARVNPLISILSLAVGFEVAGIGGALLAIPTYIIIEIIFSAISTSRKTSEK